MQGIIDLAREMNWPFAFAMAGTALAVTIPLMVARVSRAETQRREISSRSDIEQARIAASVKNGAVTLPKSGYE